MAHSGLKAHRLELEPPSQPLVSRIKNAEKHSVYECVIYKKQNYCLSFILIFAVKLIEAAVSTSPNLWICLSQNLPTVLLLHIW